MKEIIKKVFPEPLKKVLRKVENFILRLRFGFKMPVILKNKFGINFILYPEQNWPIRWMLEESSYQKEFSAMDRLIEPGNVIFDIGSHVGMIASYLAKKTTGSGKVFAFEPFPSTYTRLRENIAINNFENVILNNFAVSNRAGISKFYFDQENHQLNSLGKVDNGKGLLSNSIDVRTCTIDGFCTEHNIDRIDFLKIDTEGYEYDVLMGAEKMLTNKQIKFIQFEISKRPLESIGKKPEEIVELLKKRGYKIYDYNTLTKSFTEISSIIAGFDNYYASHNRL